MVLCVPIFEHIIIRLLCAQILGHLKIINFTFRTSENFNFFGCPNTKALYCISNSVTDITTAAGAYFHKI